MRLHPDDEYGEVLLGRLELETHGIQFKAFCVCGCGVSLDSDIKSQILQHWIFSGIGVVGIWSFGWLNYSLGRNFGGFPEQKERSGLQEYTTLQ